MPIGFEREHPAGMNENSPPFQWWEACHAKVASPAGTAEGITRAISFAPGGACGAFRTSRPTIEMVGYGRQSPWDKTRILPFEILAALDKLSARLPSRRLFKAAMDNGGALPSRRYGD